MSTLRRILNRFGISPQLSERHESYPAERKSKLLTKNTGHEIKPYNEQSKSLFFTKLPADVRYLIYALAFVYPYQDDPLLLPGGTGIHIFKEKEMGLCHRRCRSPLGQCTARCYQFMKYGKPNFGSLQLLSMVLTCHKAYVRRSIFCTHAFCAPHPGNSSPEPPPPTLLL